MTEIIRTFLEDVDSVFSDNPVHMAIGNFDEIPPGHKKMISAMREQAQNANGTASVHTFLPYPTIVINTFRLKSLICSLEKSHAMSNVHALDSIIEQKFDKQFLCQTLRGISGREDFKFGHGQAGNTKTSWNRRKLGLFVDTKIPSW
jgi:FAD synthase